MALQGRVHLKNPWLAYIFISYGFPTSERRCTHPTVDCFYGLADDPSRIRLCCVWCWWCCYIRIWWTMRMRKLCDVTEWFVILLLAWCFLRISHRNTYGSFMDPPSAIIYLNRWSVKVEFLVVLAIFSKWDGLFLDQCMVNLDEYSFIK